MEDVVGAGGEAATDLDHIIEISILKVRRIQIAGIRDERRKLLVLECLHQKIAQKIEQLVADGCLNMDRSTAFLTILHEATQRLGLNRLIRFGIVIPEDANQLPRLKLPASRRMRDHSGLGLPGPLGSSLSEIIMSMDSPTNVHKR